MKTTINAREQGWVDGVSWLLILLHPYATAELIGKFASEDDARQAEIEFAESGMALVLNPAGDF